MRGSHPARTVLTLFLTAIAFAYGCSFDRRGATEPESPAAAKAIQDYLTDFGVPGTETSWYNNIIGVSVRGNTVEVRTNLASNNQKAGDICAAVSGFVFSNQNRSYGLSNVQVLGQSGQIFINRRGVSARCS